MKRPRLLASLFGLLSVATASDVGASHLSAHLQLVRRGAGSLTTDRGPTHAVAVTLARGGRVEALRARGIAIEATPLVTGAYLARVDDAALEVLSTDPRVARVESATPTLHLQDAEVLEATGAGPAARAALADGGHWLDGSGVTLADADGDAFVFHPSLFRADAGAFVWIDVDGDGDFRPGVDAIDLDRDGLAAPGEVAALLPMETRNLAFREFGAHTGFDATTDYVFLDERPNGKRDYGKGFTEKTPAFGEPLFVADDANGNGALDVGERLLRLGTTKFSKVNARGIVYERGAKSGAGIIDYGNAVLDDLASARSPEHATYMTAIMVGGNGSNRYRGLAPGADVVLVTNPDVESLDWLVRQPSITAVSMPFGTWFDPLDGSSQTDAIVDELWKRGVVASASVGNAGRGQGHRTVALVPNVETSVELQGTYGTKVAYLNALVRAPGAKLAVELYDEVGTKLVIKSASDTSPRGTATTMLSTVQPNAIGTLVAKITLQGTSSPATAHLYAMGSINQELQFLPSGDAATTMKSPATADSNLTATGFVIHSGTNYGATEKVGERASFASRGPRVDGRALSGLATPVNPIAATIVASALDHIAVRAWPGTSASAPQTAAAAALLKQLSPALTAEAIREKLLAGAQRQSATPDPNLWGSGKLDVRAATGLALVSKPPPSVTIEVVPGTPRRLHLSVPDPAPLKARWDFDYDGAWDTDWVSLDDVDAPRSEAPSSVRVMVHDDAGNVAGATAILLPQAEPPIEAADSEATAGGCTGCTMAKRRTSPPLPRSLALLAAAGVAAAVSRRRRE